MSLIAFERLAKERQLDKDIKQTLPPPDILPENDILSGEEVGDKSGDKVADKSSKVTGSRHQKKNSKTKAQGLIHYDILILPSEFVSVVSPRIKRKLIKMIAQLKARYHGKSVSGILEACEDVEEYFQLPTNEGDQ